MTMLQIKYGKVNKEYKYKINGLSDKWRTKLTIAPSEAEQRRLNLLLLLTA